MFYQAGLTVKYNTGTERSGDTSKCHGDHSCSTFATIFYLYIPEVMPEAKSVWMQIEGDDRTRQHVKMSQTTQPRLWFAECGVTSGHYYYYGAKVSAWLGLTTAKILENGRRTVTKNSVHRDIFTSVEKNIIGGTDGYKMFLEQTISNSATLQTDSDLQVLLNEYFHLDHLYLRLADQHELGRFATECASKVALNPFAAAFVIHYLSCIYDKVESLMFSNIQECDAEHLFKTLKDWPLQQVLGARFSHRITEAMFYLVKICRKSVTWDSFVLWCYPSLSSSEVLRLFKPSGYCPTTELVTKLCSSIGHCEGAEQILSAIISHVTSLSALSQVLKTLSQSDMHQYLKYLEEWRPYFVNNVKSQLNKLHTTNHLKEMSEISTFIFSVDVTSVSEVLPAFEQTLLKILDRREDSIHYVQQLEKLISNPVIFRDKHQAVKLFQIFASCYQRSHHVLLPRLLQVQKFSVLLDDETVVQLIGQWLRVASKTSFLTSQPKSVCDLHTHIFQVSKLPDDLLKTADVKKEIQNMCMRTFCDLALPRITQMPNILHLEVLEKLCCEMRSADSQLLEHFQSSIEVAIRAIIQKISTCDLKYAQILEDLLLHDRLFSEADCSKEILECIAVSQAQNIHNMFLKMMTPEKFWKILSAGECERILDQWMAQAINFHCVNKAKKRRTVDYYILFLYEYMADVLAIPSLSSNDTVRSQVEITIKKEFCKFEPKRIIGMLDSAAGEIKEDAVTLLVLHLEDAAIKNLMPERDYHSALDRFVGTSDSKDLKAKRRYCV